MATNLFSMPAFENIPYIVHLSMVVQNKLSGNLGMVLVIYNFYCCAIGRWFRTFFFTWFRNFLHACIWMVIVYIRLKVVLETCWANVAWLCPFTKAECLVMCAWFYWVKHVLCRCTIADCMPNMFQLQTFVTVACETVYFFLTVRCSSC